MLELFLSLILMTFSFFFGRWIGARRSRLRAAQDLHPRYDCLMWEADPKTLKLTAVGPENNPLLPEISRRASHLLSVLCPSEDREQVRRHVERANAGEDVSFEHRFLSPKFTAARWVHTKIRRGIDERGEEKLFGLSIDISKVKEAEEAFRESETRFNRVFDSNMIGLLFSDHRSQKIVEANDYFLNLVGYTREDLRDGNLSWVDMTPPEYAHLNDHATEQMRKTGVAQPFEKEFYRKDGSRVSVVVGTASLNQSKTRAVTFVLDNSERKNAEIVLGQANQDLESKVAQRTEELSSANQNLLALIDEGNRKADFILESQAFLDSVVENIPNMIFVKDAKDLRFLRFNRAGEDLIGARREDLLGKNDFDLFPAEEAEAFVQKDRDVLTGSNAIDIVEEPITTKNGVRILHTKKIPVFDKNRKPLYLLGISEDITERKQAEAQRLSLMQEQAAREQAENSVEQMAFLAEASQALSASLNYKETLAQFARIVTERMADACLIDLIEEGQQFPRSIVIQHKDSAQMNLLREYRQKYPINWESDHVSAKVLRTGHAELAPEVNDEQLESVFADPRQRSMVQRMHLRSVMVVPLNVSGKILGIMSFISSKDDRHFGSLDLSIAMDLAKRASFAIENAQLYEKAQDANRAKSAFLANMSHEIRTPLGAMIGFAELIREAPSLSADQSQSVSTIIRNGKQLLRIVDEILDISKVESERINIEHIRFPLSQVIDDVRTLLQFQAEAKGLQLRWKNADDLPESVISDPTRLRQILLNVIGNAIKFTEKGFVQVHTTATASQESFKKVHLKFEVTDTGVGISPEQEARLFQPFAQADSSMTRKFGGTGLGLYLSKKLAQVLGGDLFLKKSVVGEGSLFEISIRPELPERTTTTKPAPDTTPSKDAAPALKPFRVLVVDDAPDNRVLVGRMIKSLGGAADLAENGLIGVQKALSNDYDLVLMDIQMPEMDGFEALSKLKEKKYERPIVALTAHAMKGDRELCLSRGFDHYLVKPIDREALKDTVQRYSEK